MERYRCLYFGRNARRLKEEHDILYQMNCSSVLDKGYFLHKQFIWHWLRNGLIDHVATDSHDCKNRKTNMKEAYHLLRQKLGRAAAEKLVGVH